MRVSGVHYSHYSACMLCCYDDVMVMNATSSFGLSDGARETERQGQDIKALMHTGPADPSTFSHSCDGYLLQDGLELQV